eukprot:g2397.t1
MKFVSLVLSSSSLLAYANAHGVLADGIQTDTSSSAMYSTGSNSIINPLDINAANDQYATFEAIMKHRPMNGGLCINDPPFAVPKASRRCGMGGTSGQISGKTTTVKDGKIIVPLQITAHHNGMHTFFMCPEPSDDCFTPANQMKILSTDNKSPIVQDYYVFDNKDFAITDDNQHFTLQMPASMNGKTEGHIMWLWATNQNGNCEASCQGHIHCEICETYGSFGDVMWLPICQDKTIHCNVIVNDQQFGCDQEGGCTDSRYPEAKCPNVKSLPIKPSGNTTKTPSPTPPATTKTPSPSPSGTTKTPSPSPSGTTKTPSPSPQKGKAQPWAKCGGKLYSGPTSCTAGYRCNRQSEWYSQCIPK